MRHKFTWLLSVCLLICSFHSFSQTAKFSADVNGGCSPLFVTFTNQSSGFSANATYSINFGEGGDVPFTSSASHTYVPEQSFIAVLTVTDGATIVKDTEQITVFKKPVVGFTLSTSKACVKTDVTFKSTSTPGDGTIATYVWDFGDGNLGHAATETHQYGSANSSVNVSLTVTNNYGCVASLTKPNVLTLATAPTVSFTASQTTVCSVNDPVNFTNGTTGGAQPTAYQWSFGDGKVSTSASPVHTYGLAGSFPVKLSATSADGCTDTSKITVITVAGSKSGITLPTLLCLNANLTFTDSSQPQTNAPIWMLDGSVVQNNGLHQYQTTFTDTKPHTLQLVNGYGVCSDTATKIIQAQAAPVPSPFIVNVAGNCTVPVSATFTDGGSGSTKWEWDFNNTNPAGFNPTSFQNPATTTYTAENTYYVKLRVTDASGCTGEVRQPVVIKKNTTTVTSTDGAYGCKTLSTTFKATSTNPIAQYTWTFSDDNSTSVLDTPHHIFSSLGDYKVKLKTKTTGGCNDSAVYTVHIGNPPFFDFQLLVPADTLVCGNKVISFKVTGDTDKTVGMYYWKFGDLPTYVYLAGPTYTHQYVTDSVYDVSLAINNHGCTDTVTKKAFLKVLPPFPKITAAINSCTDRMTVKFKETSKKAQYYTWDFGDKTTYSYDSLHIDTAVSHTYAVTNPYKVILTTTYGTCTAKDSITARVLRKNPNPLLSATKNQTAICASDTLFTTTSGLDLSPYGSYFKYSISAIESSNGLPFTGGYTQTNGAAAVPFYTNITGLTPGNQNIRIITSSYGFNCLDTTNFIPIQVNGPNAGFTVANPSVCLSDRIFFDDTSKQGGTAPITSWHWFFGDNKDQVLTSGGSIYHNYSDPGNYKVKLVVTDAGNCRDTAYLPGSTITVNGPKARFSIATNPILPKSPETFTNLTDSGAVTPSGFTYNWDFGDTTYSTSGANTVVHSYNYYSDDTVKLVAFSPATGCRDSVTDIVHVQNTDLKFTYTLQNPNTICPPVQVDFTNTSVNFPLVSWDFGDGQKADNINKPSHIYTTPGTYKVTIFGYYANNTRDSSWKYITIAGPTAKVHADIVPGCGAKQVIFTAETQYTKSLSWDFQDGTSSTDSVVSHFYKTPNVYTPVLTLNNGPGCIYSYPLTTPITIDSIHIIGINKDSVFLCHQLQMNFKPNIYSVAKSNNQPVDYLWSFGEGSTSTLDTTSFIYTKPGSYNVTFKATTQNGCSDSTTASVYFGDLPHATIKAPVTDFCENTPQTFSAVKSNPNDVLLFHWKFEKDTSNLQNPPPQTFTATWKDSIRLISEYKGCFDTVYQRVVIHSQPKVTFNVSDSVVCSGTPVTFAAIPTTNNPQDHFTYTWNFGNGASAPDSSVTYTYPKAGAYSPVLHVDNAGQCSGNFAPVVKMLVDSLNVSINKDSLIQCHQLLVNFKPAIFGIARSNGVPMTYLWKFGEGSTSTKDTTSFTYTKPDNYNVTFIATTQNGCTDSATTQVAYSDPFPATIQGPKDFCEGTAQVFTAVKTNPADVLTYNWQFENGTSTLQTPPAQTFTAAWKDSIRLTVDKNGCKDIIYYKPTVHGIPDVAIGLSDSVSCLGKTIIFTAKNITTLPETVTYAWDFGGGNTSTQPTASFLFPSAASYPVSLTATSSFGCSKLVKDTVLINPTPVASIQAAADACVGVPVTLKGSSNIASVQYLWQFGDNTTSSLQNPTKTYTNGFIDNLSLKVTAGNCSDTAYYTLTAHDLPLADITPVDPRVCFGSSKQITAHNGVSYQWLNATSISSASVADPYVSPSADTKYTVQVTDAYGCKNTDSVLVKVTQKQFISAVSPVNVCSGARAVLSASGTDAYEWLNGTDLTSASVPDPSTADTATTKTYQVVGSDADKCFTDTALVDVIVRALPVVTVSPGRKVTSVAGAAVQLSATADDNNVTWQWSPGTFLTCSNCQTPVSKPKQSLDYIAYATNSYGCKGSDTVSVNVVCLASLIDVPSIFSPNNDGRNDKFHLVAQGIQTIKHMVIYGRNGNKVFERNNVDPLSSEASWDGMSDHQYMPTGTYIYIIQAVCEATGEIFNLQGTVTLIR